MLCCRDRWSVGWELYLADEKAHLGFRGCPGGLSGQRSSHCPHSPTLQAPELALHFLLTSRLHSSCSLCLECLFLTVLPGKLLPILINSCLFHEAFPEPARRAYHPPRNSLKLWPLFLITSCLAYLQPVDLEDRALAWVPLLTYLAGP